MASSLSLLLLSFVCIVVTSDNLQVGTSINGSLAYSEVVKLSSVPLKIRTKNVFYTDENNRIIKGISAIDMDKSKAQATVTSGGVGFSFANVRIKSERGDGINYQVQFFV
ncbi:uncharacterized protein [Choristoneura fumiferana]|uniref:uncharacterized protein n=1 Tax=Choristoneura fumiferana TaxID=7141 RepID=UPI003D157F0E